MNIFLAIANSKNRNATGGYTTNSTKNNINATIIPPHFHIRL